MSTTGGRALSGHSGEIDDLEDGAVITSEPLPKDAVEASTMRRGRHCQLPSRRHRDRDSRPGRRSAVSPWTGAADQLGRQYAASTSGRAPRATHPSHPGEALIWSLRGLMLEELPDSSGQPLLLERESACSPAGGASGAFGSSAILTWKERPTRLFCVDNYDQKEYKLPKGTVNPNPMRTAMRTVNPNPGWSIFTEYYHTWTCNPRFYSRCGRWSIFRHGGTVCIRGGGEGNRSLPRGLPPTPPQCTATPL